MKTEIVLLMSCTCLNCKLFPECLL